jgi:hypothetical protein
MRTTRSGERAGAHRLGPADRGQDVLAHGEPGRVGEPVRRGNRDRRRVAGGRYADGAELLVAHAALWSMT